MKNLSNLGGAHDIKTFAILAQPKYGLIDETSASIALLFGANFNAV
jgi:hypothetical protein